MPVHNVEVARAFEEIADLLELRGANPFRVRAYRNAAQSVGNRALDLVAAVRAGRALPKLPGIGADLAGKIEDLARTGTTPLLERLRAKAPAGVSSLLRVPGLGPRRVQILVRKLGVDSVAALERAAAEGAIHGQPGFGPKSEAALLEAARAQLSKERRFPRTLAAAQAERLLRELRQARGVRAAVAAGSLRRGRDTVGDIDLLVAAEDSSDAMRRFVRHPEVQRVIAGGATKASVLLRSGIQADLRVVPPRSYGAALVYFTGCKAHNIALRRLAQSRGLKINEYGVYRGARRVAGDTEESVYAALGLRPIPPGQREDRGEIDLARQRRRPPGGTNSTGTGL
jgi:DNA polymerase (family 10)